MKKVSLFVLSVGLLLVIVGCTKSVEKNEEMVKGVTQESSEETNPGTTTTNTEENGKTEGESEPDTNDSLKEFDVKNYLEEHYPVENTHYVTQNGDKGKANYTINIVADTEEYSDEMKEKFENGHTRVYEEIEVMVETAEKIMNELPKINSNLHIDSVNWVSHDGEFSVMLTQDFENSSSQVDTQDSLSQYSSQQIEYARVWLLLGPNQEIDELNVTFIPAGQPVNPYDETSATYPETVIQLAGSRLVDGSVTYSGNGDGTINVYKVPLRFEQNVPDDLDENYMRELTTSMIENTELVYVDPGEEKEIIKLIKLLSIHH